MIFNGKLSILNNDILVAVLVVIGLFLFVKYVDPFMKKKKLAYYNEVKLGLMVLGYALREDKLKQIANEALEIVRELEALALHSIEKHDEAVYQLSRRLLDKYEISIEDGALDLIVDMAVALLVKTN